MAAFRNPNNDKDCIVLDELHAINKRLVAAIERIVTLIIREESSA